MIRNPLRDRQVGGAKRLLQRTVPRVVQFAVCFRQQDHGMALKDFGHVTHRHARHVSQPARHSELAAHGVQQSCTTLARTGDSCLLANACDEIGDDECDDQHDGERHEVLSIRDGKRELGRNEEEIESRDVQDRCQRRGAPAQS